MPFSYVVINNANTTETLYYHAVHSMQTFIIMWLTLDSRI